MQRFSPNWRRGRPTKIFETQNQMKLLLQMNSKELKAYYSNLVHYKEETLPRLFALEDAWEEQDFKDYDEGLQLVLAFQTAKSFVTSAYRFDVEDRLRRINGFIEAIAKWFQRFHPEIKEEIQKGNADKSVLHLTQSHPVYNEKGEHTGYGNVAFAPPAPMPDEDGNIPPQKTFIEAVNDMEQQVGNGYKHVSDILHLLSPETRKRALSLPDLYLSLTSLRQKCELLYTNKRASETDRKYFADQLTKTEDNILNIYEHIKMEVEAANGMVISEEAKNKILQEAEKFKERIQKPGEYTKDDIDLLPEGEEKESLRAARIERNKKFLRRKDIQTSPEHAEAMRIAATELLEWGIKITPAIIENLRRHGVTLPSESEEQQHS